MDNVMEEGVIVHASQYYDPVKAHEYYLRTRELKGRQARARGEGLNSRQREGFEYSKSEIAKAREADLEKAQQDVKTQIETFRDEALAKVEEFTARVQEILDSIETDEFNAINEINTKLKTDLSKVDSDLKTELETIADEKRKELVKIQEEVSRQLAAVPKVPKGVSKETAIRLAEKRSEELARIRGEGAKAKASVSEEYSKDATYARDQAKAAKKEIRDKASEEIDAVSTETANQKSLVNDYSSSERAKVVDQVKEFVATAKQNYEKLKQELVAKYDEQVQSEYDAIKTTVR